MKDKLAFFFGQQRNFSFFLCILVLVCLAITLFLNFFDYETPMVLWVANVGLALGVFSYYTLAQGLLTYVIKRLAEALTVVLVIASLTFLLLRILPGGPFDHEKALPPEVKANIEAKYKLNAPLHVQYMDYMWGLFQGDLGESYKYIGRPITEILAETLPNSIHLGLYALILSFMIGIPAGVYAASRHNTLADNITMIIAISGVSLPSFLVAPLLILFFCFYLELLPPALWEGPEFYLLPIVTLGVRPAAVIARLTRSSVLDVIRSDYIRTARAKGLSEIVILYKHVLKNSLIPVLTFSGPLVAGILTGSFVIELIFAVPGMAKHLIQSVSNRDYPLILGTTLVFSLALVVANLVVDLLYAYFDPRIKLA